MYQPHTTIYPGGVAMLVESGGSDPPLDTDGRQSVLLLGCLCCPRLHHNYTFNNHNYWVLKLYSFHILKPFALFSVY